MSRRKAGLPVHAGSLKRRSPFCGPVSERPTATRASSAASSAPRRVVRSGRTASLAASLAPLMPGHHDRSGPPRAASVRTASREPGPCGRARPFARPSCDSCSGVSVAMRSAPHALGDLDVALEDLARWALGQLVEEPQPARVLVGGHALLDEVAHVVLGRVLTVLEHHRGADLLPHLLVGHRDHGGLGHGGVLVEDLLDLARVDVVAAADDHVLLAVDDEEVAVLVDAGHVARVEPAVAQDLLRGVVAVPVALHEVVAADRDLADLALAHLVAVLVDDLHLDALDRRPDGARLALLVGVVEGRDRRGLRQAVALEDLAPERLLEAAQDLDGERRATRDAQPQARGVVAIALGVVEDRVVHRRHALEDRHAVAVDHLERLARVEARDQVEAGAALDARVQPARLPERVEQRQRPEHHVVLGDLRERARRDLGVGEQARVRQLGALRRAGRAGRVEDHGGVVVGAVGDLVHGLGLAEQPLELAGLDDDGLCARLARALLRGGGEVAPGEQRLGPGVLDVELDLAALEQHVHRHDGAARAQHAVVDDRELRDVGQHEPDAVARADPALAKEAGDPGGRVVERLVGDHRVVELERRALRVPLCALGEQRRQVRHCPSPLSLCVSAALPAERTGHDTAGPEEDTMATVYVSGHRNPDLDSIGSAIGYAELKQRLRSDDRYVPVRLGPVNAQTRWALDRSGADEPDFLRHIRLRVRDVMQHCAVTVAHDAPVREVGRAMTGEGLDLVAVTDEDGELAGVVSERDLARMYIRESQSASTFEDRPVRLQAINAVLGGRIVAGEDREVSGRLWVVAVDVGSMEDRIGRGDIAVVGDRPDAQRRALELGVAVLVTSYDTEPGEDLVALAREHDAAVIVSPLDSYVTGRMVQLAVPCATVMSREPLTASPDDLLAEVADRIKDVEYRAAIAIDADGAPVGIVSRSDLVSPSPRRVLLVDHAEQAQSVPGIEEAEIVEILDHHHIGSIETRIPVKATFDPVGSTATLVVERFRQNGMEPSRPAAMLLLGAVLSDTVILSSPTTTERDRAVVEYLERVLALDATEFGRSMFESTSDFSHVPAEDIVGRDAKEYDVGGGATVCIAQVETVGESLAD